MHIKKLAKLQKPLFTHEQIALRAYQISQKNPECSPDENWDAAIKSLKQERIFQPLIRIWRWTGISEKKGWDILQLLITASIPLLLFFGTQYFSIRNSQQQQEAAIYRAQQETLVKYLDQMSEAIKTDDLLSAKPDPKSLIIAQIRTITALQSLNPDRQRAIIQFLRAADLLNPAALNPMLNPLALYHLGTVEKKSETDSQGIFYKARMPAINLKSSDLSGADLRSTDLSSADLSSADLRGADLSEAYLRGANFRGAKLIVANVRGANLSEADFRGANLFGADLSSANISEANLSEADLISANLSSANLIEANISGANLRVTDLSGADLSGANLRGADLSRANLSGANLSGVKNYSATQIKSAKNWESALSEGKRLDDPEINKQLGLDAKQEISSLEQKSSFR
jgi:uncharacterized protein YjbI with pentapeptide repeats